MKLKLSSPQQLLLCALLVGSVGIAPAGAAMAPAYEAQALLVRLERGEQARAAAPLSIRAKVLDLEQHEEPGNGCPALRHVRAQLQVEQQLRGVLEPAQGQRLQLRYSEAEYRCPGPGRSRLPELQIGQSYSLLLRCDPEACEPAAGAFSFDSDAEFARRLDDARAWAARQPRRPELSISPAQRP